MSYPHIPADPTWELVAWGIQKLRPRLWTTGLGHFEMLNIDHQTESNPSNFLGGVDPHLPLLVWKTLLSFSQLPVDTSPSLLGIGLGPGPAAMGLM